MSYLVLLALLASCAVNPDTAHEGVDAGDAGDARPPDTVCGVPVPGNVPPSIRIEGTISTVTSSGTQLPDGISVSLRKSDGTEILANTVTEAGAYSMTVATHGAPVDAYIHAVQGGSNHLLSYPGVPYTWDVASKNALAMMEPAQLDSYVGVPSTPNTGSIIVATHDCEMDSVLVGATVTPSSGPSIHYLGSDSMNVVVKLAPDSTTVGAIISNVPPGEVTIWASTPTRELRTAHVLVFGNGLTLVDLYPQ